MTKQDVIQKISTKTGLDELTSRTVVEAFFEVIKDSLTEGEPIYIRTFGSFSLKYRAQKVARDLNQNTAVILPAHHIPAFKPSREFVERVKTQAVAHSLA